jgi:mRNA interferase RelE/StbE
MARYSLLFKESVAKDLRRIPRQDVQRILDRIGQLADDPRPPGARKLSGEEKYPIRIGMYRVLYTVDDTMMIVVIIKVGNRRD